MLVSRGGDAQHHHLLSDVVLVQQQQPPPNLVVNTSTSPAGFSSPSSSSSFSSSAGQDDFNNLHHPQQQHLGGSPVRLMTAESKVTFLSLGSCSPPRSLPASRASLSSSPQPMSRFMNLARKFNCFYFNGDLQRCRPFLVAGKQVGVMQPRVLEAALRHSDVFLLDASTGSVWLHPSLATYEERSARINAVLSQWREEGSFVTLKGWRDECYEVRAGFADPPLLKMERSATCLFGIRQYGVEINGYTRHPHLGVCLWLQRRSFSKPTWPGKWDNMVAGGLSVGHSVLDTALKEADEEASIPPHLLLNLKSAGSVSFYFESERGLFPNTELVYDLELPPDFVPRNSDGEVDSFELVPVAQVMERLLTADYKTTSCPTTLDFLIRHGHLNPDNEPNLPELVELLHIPLHYLYNNHSSSIGLEPNTSS